MKPVRLEITATGPIACGKSITIDVITRALKRSKRVRVLSHENKFEGGTETCVFKVTMAEAR